LVKSLSGGLGLKTRRPPGRFCRALRFRFSFFLPAGIPVVPIQASILSHSHAHTSHPPLVRPEKNPRNKPGTTLTPSGGTSENRYNLLPPRPFPLGRTGFVCLQIISRSEERRVVNAD